MNRIARIVDFFSFKDGDEIAQRRAFFRAGVGLAALPLLITAGADEADAATNFLWGAEQSAQTLLTTELNSLANESTSAMSSEIDNTTGKWQMCRLWLHLASNSLAFTSSSFAMVYFLPNIDAAGTYPTFTSGTGTKLATPNYGVAAIGINPVTQSANVVDEAVDYALMNIGKFKAVLQNLSGVAFPASGNELKLIATPSQY